jgi:two-component system chemotaxis response regulator CheY
MKTRLLIVDDSEGQRAQLRRVLESEGYEIDEAVDGIRACAKVHQERFDGVICDVNMPFMDGIKFVALIKLQAKNKSLPVLMLTSESSSDMRRRGKEAGANLWMVKPFEPDELVQTVKEMIRSQSAASAREY